MKAHNFVFTCQLATDWKCRNDLVGLQTADVTTNGSNEFRSYPGNLESAEVKATVLNY